MIQFDYPNGGIGKKDRKRYTFSDFRGVDKSVAEINVAPNHAVESTNFVDRNGVLHKRYGWEQVYQFEGEINGFWELYLDGIKHTICYAGNIFYRKTENGWKEAYKSKYLVSRRTACYTQNKKAYFIGCGDFLVFRFDNESGKYAFFRVYDDAETYIPTTTAQISPADMVLEGIGEQYARDSVNLLTGWRKNTLVGVAVPEGGELQYKLDSVPSMEEDDTAEIIVSGVVGQFKLGEAEIVYPLENDDLAHLSFTADGVNLDAYSETIITNPLTEEDIENGVYRYPDVAYDEIKEAGAYGAWILRILTPNGIAGLRWKRELDCEGVGVNIGFTYRVYTLYFLGDSGSTQVPIAVARRYYRNPRTQHIDFEFYSYEYITSSSSSGKTVVTVTFSKTSDMYVGRDIEFAGSVVSKGGSVCLFEGEISAGAMSASVSVKFMNDDSVHSINVRYVDTVLRYEEEASSSNAMDTSSLPECSKKTVSVSDFATGGQAVLLSFDETYGEIYRTVSSFVGNTLSCKEEKEGVTLIDATIDSFGVLSVSDWLVVEETAEKAEKVVVKFKKTHDKSNLVTTCKYSTLYGVAEEANRLFVANGEDTDKSNIIFFSELDDFTYFPDTFTKAVGGSANEVKGFIRLANGSMAALKSLNGNEPTVFVFNGEYISGYYDAEQTEPYTLPKFSTSGVSTTQGIAAPYACSNLADDSLFLSQNGVYALELSQGTDSQRFAKERSLPINNLLRECNIEEIQEACAITHDNKYYLALPHYRRTKDCSVVPSKTYYEKVGSSYKIVEVPDEDTGMSKYYERESGVYVADAHYTFKPIGAMADTFSYEWYPLINIPVRVWFLLDGELYFGTNDGRICKFVENQYYDVEKLYLALDVESADVKAYSQKQVKAITTVLDANADGNIDTFSIAEGTDINDGDTIIFTSGTVLGLAYEEVQDLLNVELHIKKCTNSEGLFEGNIQLKYTPDGEVIEFVRTENLVATIQKKKVVKASRTMPTFDFGMPDYLKTLESFTITMNGVEGGYALLDISTRNNRNFVQKVKGQSHYDSLNGFSQTSFNVPFQNSFTKKILIRNFNYAIFKIDNDMPVDCSVSSISVMYKYNRASGGIK